MTNSIASSKCPILLSGNYGMSQNRCTDNTKEFIFVKLTDSAFRAVEEYDRNKNSKSLSKDQHPKIRFSGNSGIIHFPIPNSSEERKFGFAIDDVDGSLECIQQRQNNQLDVLGSLSHRLRVHANDDVYDTTRTKMAIAEETEKSKCIREIKPNQTDIGRTVKKLIPASSFHHNINHNFNGSNNNSSSNHYLGNSNNSRSKLASLSSNGHSASSKFGGNSGGATASSSRSPNPTMLGGSGTVGNSSNNAGNGNRYGSMNALSTASSLSSTFASGISNGYASAASRSPNEPTTTKGKIFNQYGNGSSSNTSASNVRANSGSSITTTAASKVSLSKTNSKGGGSATSSTNKLPDISKRKIRERLIHTLALRPFKKPELYARLQSEGLRGREGSLIGNILKDIATLSRDNTYNLRRQMWNDVNENWPFYTEQELQMLKRRKPQNLTPPMSSDAGSSTSGQSPTSTHTGSPPPLGLMGSGNSGLKRASLDVDRYEDVVQPKKQRISHFKKDPIATGSLGATNRINGSSNINYGLQNRNMSSTTSSYSPRNVSGNSHNNLQNADETPGSSDLSFNVLDNVDDFMSHMEQSSGNYFAGNASGTKGRKSNGSNSSTSSNNNNNNNNNSSNNINKISCNSSGKNAMNLKEKRNSGGNSNTNCSNLASNYGKKERVSSKELMKKSSTSSASPTATLKPYVCNFVPESKKSTSSNISSSNSNNRNGSACYQRNSPSNYLQQQHKSSSNNSVIFSNKMLADDVSPRKVRNSPPSSSSKSSSTKPVRASSGNNSNKHQQPMPITNKPSARVPPTPLKKPEQQRPPSSSLQPPQSPMSTSTHSAQFPQNSRLTSPTQQIADAASSYSSSMSSSLSPSGYDFSRYAPITTLEQRRQYKTEFERDYDEYSQLLKQIDAVGKHFRELAECLENLQPNSTDYNNFKLKIANEYERIRNEETLKRGKERFDYLHEKLAYIKQLVMDYDKKLTSVSAAANVPTSSIPMVSDPTASAGVSPAAAAAATAANETAAAAAKLMSASHAMHQISRNLQMQQQQHLQHQQFQQQQIFVKVKSEPLDIKPEITRLSPMAASGHSNNSSPSAHQDHLQSALHYNRKNSLSSISPQHQYQMQQLQHHHHRTNVTSDESAVAIDPINGNHCIDSSAQNNTAESDDDESSDSNSNDSNDDSNDDDSNEEDNDDDDDSNSNEEDDRY